MKFIIVFAALFAVALAAPRPEEAEILNLDAEINENSFRYEFDTSDNVHVDAAGEVRNVGSENEALQVKGSYSFVADDGQTYTVNYIADENGFQPQGAHIPTAP